ncbi:MAG: NepR family anti-sigma factor [Hyphomicrobium sp.]
MELTTGQMGTEPGEREGLDARLQAQIGQKLKAMFDQVANEPIPDKFIDLLNKLDGQETTN